MSLAFRYLLGVAACLGGGAVLAWAVAPVHRAGALWGVFAGVVLQAPLGWITLRAIGTDRFIVVWGVGMLVRLATVGIAALILIPALGPEAQPMLVSMVGVLGALLLIEGIVAMREHSGEDEG
jgi:hypothetical protein